MEIDLPQVGCRLFALADLIRGQAALAREDATGNCFSGALDLVADELCGLACPLIDAKGNEILDILTAEVPETAH